MSPVKKKKKAVAQVESQLLKRVRVSNGLSRVELARAMRLSPSTVGIYVDRLIEDGFLLEGEKAERDYGRPPTMLSLNPRGGQFIGVDFEARNIRATALDFSHQPIHNAHQTIGKTDSVARILNKIEEAIEVVRPDDVDDLLGIGVGVPGVVDPIKGTALYYPYIRDWKNVPLAAHLTERFKTPVYLENNVRSMALAELWFGQGRNVDNFICIGARSGLSAGIVLDGHLYRGSHYSAGEIGHWRASLDPIGSKELQEIASVEAIIAATREAIARGRTTSLAKSAATPGDVSINSVIHAAEQGDALALEALENAAAHLGWASAQLIALFNPQKVILAGPLAAAGAILLRPIQNKVRQLAQFPSTILPEIVTSDLGEFSGALGAAALALHEWKPTR